MLKLKFVGLSILLLLFAGCASNEYYRDKAANSARDYILSEYHGMSQENRAFIEYTYPTILLEPIFNSSDLYNQLCFAWSLPSPKVVVLVYGAGKADFHGWFPQRLIFKQYPKELAAQKAVDFILDQHADISDKNRFYIEQTFPSTLLPEKTDKAKPVASDMTNSIKKQDLCLGWVLPSPKFIILVYGSGEQNFSQWNPTHIEFYKYSEKLANQLKTENVFSNETDLNLDSIIKRQESKDETGGWSKQLNSGTESQLGN